VNSDTAAKLGTQSMMLEVLDSSDKGDTMKQNENMTDRIIRVVAGVVLLALGLFSHSA
jgi:hypothetical protein